MAIDMKNWKRICAAALCVVLLAGLLGGCSKKKDDGSSLSSQPGASAAGIDKPYQVGLLQYAEHPSYDALREAFMSRLEEWDCGESQLKIDYQNAGGDEKKAETICQKFVTDKVDMIVAISSPAAKAAIAAADQTEVKVVFADVADPEKELGTLGSNVTGVRSGSTVSAVVDLALQADPNLKTFGVLYNPQEAVSRAQAEELKKYCGEKQLEVVETTLAKGAKPEEVTKAVTELCGKAGAIFTPIDSTVNPVAATVAAAASAAKRPWYAGADAYVQSGALAAVSPDYDAIGRQAADMAVELMSGKSVAEVPVAELSAHQTYFSQTTLDELKTVFPAEVLEAANFYTSTPAAAQSAGEKQ